MTVTFTLSKSDLVKRARMIVAYVGAKANDYDRLAANEADEEMTSLLWDNARAYAHGIVTALQVAESATDAFKAHLRVPDAFSVDSLPYLDSELQRFFATHIAGQWLQLAASPAADTLLAQGRQALSPLLLAAAPNRRP